MLEWIRLLARTFDPLGYGLTFFVTCFSEKRDHHGQWQEYADEGQGFSLQFSASDLAENMTVDDDPHGGKVTLAKVQYYEDEQRALIRSYLDGCLSIWRNDGIVVESHDLASQLKEFCIVFKDHRYSDESEWRLFTDVNLRSFESSFEAFSCSSGLSIYRKVFARTGNPERPNLPITEVLPGPENRSLHMNGVFALLLKGSVYFQDVIIAKPSSLGTL